VLADQLLCALLKLLAEQDSEPPSPVLLHALPLQKGAREEAAAEEEEEEEEHWTSGGVAGGASSNGANDRTIGNGNG
jgi:hypothetical protein